MSLRMPVRRRDTLDTLGIVTGQSSNGHKVGYASELEPYFLLIEAIFKGCRDGRFIVLAPMHYSARLRWLEDNTPSLYAYITSRAHREPD